MTMTMPAPAAPQTVRGGSTGRAAPVNAPDPSLAASGTPTGQQRMLDNWLNIQSINLTRHARALRPFIRDEFGTSPAAPSEAHVEAVNRFIDRLRSRVTDGARWVEAAANMARRQPTSARLNVLLERKQAVGNRVLYVEGIWDFYFDLFVQRLSVFGERLRAIDRIAANCYEDLYTGLGTAQPTPALLPFSYAASGFSPATYRRGVPLRRLRHNANLFPLITLPQHRLDNVWALSSVLHECSHNLQADLGLWDELPVRIYTRLTKDGRVPARVARVWAAWHKEMMADMLALVLGGPAAVESLMDVVGRAPSSTLRFSAIGVHPTPVLRVPISLVLLKRIGFGPLATDLGRAWRSLYPRISPTDIPAEFMSTFRVAAELAVDTMVFQRYPQLGKKSVSEVIEFGQPQMRMIEQAGRRLALGQDPGSVPLRFMIGAARFAIDQRLAAPQAITDNFYRILGRR